MGILGPEHLWYDRWRLKWEGEKGVKGEPISCLGTDRCALR